MGLIESRQIKSAIASDGLQKVKKVAFIKQSVEYLERERLEMKKQWEIALEEKLQEKIRFIQTQKQQCGRLFDEKVNEIELKDSDMIDRLQAKMKKSFKDITGYRKTIQKLQIEKNRTYKNWNQQTVKVMQQIDVQTEHIREKLLRETPQTPKLNQLDPSTRQKVLALYIEDDSYEIQRDQYNRRALGQLERAFPFQQVVEERFEKRNSSQDSVKKIVKEFAQNLKGNFMYSPGCGFGW